MPTSPSWGSRKRCQGQLTQGQLTQVTQVKTGTTTLASNASYYPNGALAQFTYGNGIVHTMTQNARQLPSHSVDGSVLDLSAVFDENGNVAAITDNTASARQTRSMSYDGLDRLTATTSPMFGTASYAYDPQDNLTRVQVTGGSQPRDHYYCYNASNQLAFVRSGPNCTGTTSPAVIALAYDVQGNLSIKNGASYAFDFGNRLRTTAGQSYRYDAQGRRVRQDVAGSQLQYSQYAADGRLVWQRDETTNQRIANAYLAGSLLAEISRPLTGSTTTIRYLHTDALGSPIAKTSTSGAIIETSEYEPYGRLLNRANDNRAGYTGHVMDAASGLTYMQARYYDPSIGRFLSVDPVTADSAGGGNFNRYWYADGNPYGFTDPDGRQSRSEQDRASNASSSPCVGDLCTGHYESSDGNNNGLPHEMARDSKENGTSHVYDFTIWLCETRYLACTIDNMIALGEPNSAPTSFSLSPGTKLVDGRNVLSSLIPFHAPNNPIMHYADFNGNRIINIALPGHVFRGFVIHQFYEANGRVWVRTHGYGTGQSKINSYLNNLVGNAYFEVWQKSLQLRATNLMILSTGGSPMAWPFLTPGSP